MKTSRVSLSESRSSDSVSLLISILVRFPQIGTVKIDSKKQVLWLNFMLAQSVVAEEIDNFQQQTLAALGAYHYITGQTATVFQIETKQPYEKFCLLSIGRDLASVTRGELSLLITLLSEHFKDRIILDDSEFMADMFDEFSFPDDFIDSMLENVKFHRTAKNLTALRENGRVLVFSK
jgi:hypothetical protein